MSTYLYVYMISVSQQLPSMARRYKMGVPFVFVQCKGVSPLKPYALHRDCFLASSIVRIAFTNNPRPEPPEILVTRTERSPDSALTIVMTGVLKIPMATAWVRDDLEAPWWVQQYGLGKLLIRRTEKRPRFQKDHACRVGKGRTTPHPLLLAGFFTRWFWSQGMSCFEMKMCWDLKCVVFTQLVSRDLLGEMPSAMLYRHRLGESEGKRRPPGFVWSSALPNKGWDQLRQQVLSWETG